MKLLLGFKGPITVPVILTELSTIYEDFLPISHYIMTTLASRETLLAAFVQTWPKLKTIYQNKTKSFISS